MYTKNEWKSEHYYNFKYLQYLPKDFSKDEKYPLVVFLHGAGERGDDLDLVARHGFFKHVRESGKEYPFICVGPQCPNDKYWGCFTESLLAFLDEICSVLPVDKSRIYLTGLSMGGTGTFMLAMADPSRFTAIAPVCGSGIVWYGFSLKGVPTYMYHGDLDDIVPIEESITMLKKINGWGGNAQLKICNGVKHNAWDIAYAGDELVNWLLSHKKNIAE
jgi:predicted peptidase